MSRHRSISTDISTDTQVAELAEHGPLPLLLYTWAIPHADDWGRMTGDPRQFKLLVCPGLDLTARDVEQALTLIAEAALWLRYEVGGKWYIAFPPSSWFRHQNYVPKSKRDADKSAPRPAAQGRDLAKRLVIVAGDYVTTYIATSANTDQWPLQL
jgi:hypothetical protein